MNEERLRAAIVGCGRIGTLTSDRVRKALPKGWLPLNHAEAICSLPGLELAAVCDVDAERARAAARLHGVREVFTDYRAMIAAIKPDILSVATRTQGRCDIIEFAAGNGVRGIHAEKPLGRSLADCRRAMRAVAEREVKLSYGTTRRYMDVYRRARELVAGGAIGQLVQITVEYGRGLLMWGHPHSIDLILFFAGCDQVSHLSATCDVAATARSGDVVDADPIVENAFIKFANGVHGLIATASGSSVRLAGTTGILEVPGDGAWIEADTLPPEGDPYQRSHRRIEVQPVQSGTQRAFAELAAAVRHGNATSIGWRDVELASSLLLGCAYSSVEGGRRISLAEVSDNFTVTGRFGELCA